MRERLLPLGLIAAMLVSVVGVGAHEHEGTCPLTKLPDCCKKAKLGANATEVSKARLCCNFNCSEPGSGGSNASSSFSPQQSVAPMGLVLPNSLPSSNVAFSSHQPARPNYSSPKYIQHLALLI